MLSFLTLFPAYATPTSSQDVLMYHVNPKKYGPVPINMDTADEAGDLFFEMMEVLSVPLACSDPTRDPRSGFECNNPEATSTDDVVNKLTLTVTGGFSGCALASPVTPSGPPRLKLTIPSSVYGRCHVQHRTQRD